METVVIKTLANDTSIVIKEAGKGGATIIMGQSHYKNMVENTLNDKNFYETLDSDPSKAEKLKYTKFLTNHKNCLTKRELEYLEKFEVNSSIFYGLPKVHKSSHINNKCKNANSSYVEISDVNDLKLRPIVEGPSCQTHRLSDIIDILLKPYKHVNSYLRDTIDFLNTLPLTVKEETMLAPFDVESLYTNIPHELAIRPLIIGLINTHRKFKTDLVKNSFWRE